MMIPKETILAHIQERLNAVALSNISDMNRTEQQTAMDRGCYRAYRELVNWIETNFSEG